MSKTIVKIKTWTCPSCGYYQDFDPEDEALMKKHFPRVFALYKIEGKPVDTGKRDEQGNPITERPVRYEKEYGFCPACFLGQNPEKEAKKVKMERETREEKKTKLTVMGEEEVEELEKETGELDNEGNPVMRKLNAQEKQEKIQEIRNAVKRAKKLEDK